MNHGSTHVDEDEYDDLLTTLRRAVDGQVGAVAMVAIANVVADIWKDCPLVVPQFDSMCDALKFCIAENLAYTHGLAIVSKRPDTSHLRQGRNN